MWLDHSRGRATPKDGKVALWQLTLARDSVPDWPQWKLETRESMRRSPTSRGSNLPLVCQVQHPWLGARYWAPCCDLSSIVVDLKHSVVTNQNQSHFCFKNSINQPASLQRDQRAETKEMFIQNISFLNLLKKSCEAMTIVKSSAHRWLTSHLKFQPSLANVWLFVVAKNHVQLILWKMFFWSIVLKSLCHHHQIVDITLKLHKGPGTRTVFTTYGLKNTGICSCIKQ